MIFDQLNDFTKQFMNFEQLDNSGKNFAKTNFSGMANSMNKNAEVLFEANKNAMQQMQNIAKKTADMLQNNLSDTLNNLQNLYETKDLEQAALKQQDYIRSSLNNSLNQAKEVMELATNSSINYFEEVSNALTKKFQENIDVTKQNL